MLPHVNVYNLAGSNRSRGEHRLADTMRATTHALADRHTSPGGHQGNAEHLGGALIAAGLKGTPTAGLNAQFAVTPTRRTWGCCLPERRLLSICRDAAGDACRAKKGAKAAKQAEKTARRRPPRPGHATA
jgi:hypothetical protein